MAEQKKSSTAPDSFGICLNDKKPGLAPGLFFVMMSLCHARRIVGYA